MKTISYVLVLLVCAVVTYLALFSGERKPTPAALAKIALTNSDKEKRKQATVQLSLLPLNIEVMSALRHLVEEGNDVDVKIIALDSLTPANDMGNLPVFYKAMGQPELNVRRAGLEGAMRVFGGTLPENIQYDLDDPEEERQRVASQLMVLYQKWKEQKPRPDGKDPLPQ